MVLLQRISDQEWNAVFDVSPDCSKKIVTIYEELSQNMS